MDDALANFFENLATWIVNNPVTTGIILFIILGAVYMLYRFLSEH